ncbi:DUF5615 family PIN-like protein [[Phormidium] sp. ETS-05]|uniref:DUF5615 family PIN-like protein n=1 Tax=[Phormidium] sp. ETS-05 TaxID=222819 RepID=UPI0018EF071B|nr:DUF5615 family PIN-like protein [[Phormidium] sp. ETS-05]
MKFLVDAQLPLRLARFLQLSGYDTLHTKDLKLGNSTPDSAINDISLQENRIVITKDRDFYDSFLIKNEPYKLLIVTTGNITNADLENLFKNNLPQLTELFQVHSLIEMSRHTLVVHQ